VSLPKLNGLYASEAESILLAEGLKYSVQNAGSSKEFKVKDQYPKPGEKIEKGGTVYLYAK
jgi:beta-lactam-binding protein with PASTA domain